jgi:hypothetical protein
MAKILASEKLARRSTGSNEVEDGEADIRSGDCPALAGVFTEFVSQLGVFS